jgi:hypothetical protein
MSLRRKARISPGLSRVRPQGPHTTGVVPGYGRLAGKLLLATHPSANWIGVLSVVVIAAAFRVAVGLG